MPTTRNVYLTDETAQTLAVLARRWGLSASATIARALQLVAEGPESRRES